MLKLNRTTEYGLMALSYIRTKSAGEISSAREIADFFSLPFEILAKTLQRLKDQGVIASSYGTRGGYVLSRDLKELYLAEFLRMMEGPVSVVACAESKGATTNNQHLCEYSPQCSIKPNMTVLNDRLYEFLSRISLEELTRETNAKYSSNATTTESAMTTLQGEEP